jgi:hypothetical protein
MSIQALQRLDAEGYFAKAAAGDHRACGLFARLAAYTLNPNGDADGWGCLRKTGGGANVEGYSEDAIVLGSDPNNLHNVKDIIVGAGAPGARLVGSLDGLVNRRTSDIWERPAPLNAEQLNYLKPGATTGGGGGGIEPPPPPPAGSTCQFQPVDLSVVVESLLGLVRVAKSHDESLATAIDETRQVKAELLNLIARLEQGFTIDASSRYLGSVKGTVRLPK